MLHILLDLNNSLSKTHKNILFLFYLIVIFLSNYFLLSNEFYLKGMLENIKTSVENREVVDMTKRGMNAMLQNPAMIALYSLKLVFRNFYSLLMLVLLCWLMISFYTDKWISILQIYYSLSSALVLLIFGAVMNFGGMYLTYSAVSWFEFGAYCDYFSLHPFVKKLSAGYNIFTILTLVAFSKFISISYSEKFTGIFYLVNLSWLLIVVGSYFLDFSVVLI